MDHDFEIDAQGYLKEYTGSSPTVKIPDGVRTIGPFAFYEREDITFLTIPEGVTEIKDAAFFGCTGISELVIPDSVEYIRVSAFAQCKGLKRIVLGKSIRLINDTGLESRLNHGALDVRIRSAEITRYLSLPLEYAAVEGFLARHANKESDKDEERLFFPYLRRIRDRLVRQIPSVPLCLYLTEHRALTASETDAWISETDSVEIRALLLDYKNEHFSSGANGGGGKLSPL